MKVKNGTRRKESVSRRANKVEIIKGTLSKHKRGFGFVIPESGEGEDIFISPPGINGAMNGDYVEVRLLTHSETGSTREGVIEQILKRAATDIVGTFEKSKRFGFVVPYDKRLNDDVFVLKRILMAHKQGIWLWQRSLNIRTSIIARKEELQKSLVKLENQEEILRL